MIDLIIITHGLFGEELFLSTELIIGKQDNVHCLSVIPEKSVNEVVRELDAIIGKSSSQGIIIFTDMFGGSPSNIAFSYSGQPNIEIISGVNMPMLLKAFTGRMAGENLAFLASACREAGIKSIKVANELIKPKKN
jgi:PTS system mannose-specific IIA component